MRLTLIAAVAKNRVIGQDGQMPWGRSMKSDLAFFKKTTLGKPVAVGRKTFESILSSLGKPLPGRRLIVLSRNPQYRAEGCLMAQSLEEAVSICGSDELFVAGGTELYATAMPLADRMLITRVEEVFTGDSLFPVYKEDEWRVESSESQHYSGDTHPSTRIEYARIR